MNYSEQQVKNKIKRLSTSNAKIINRVYMYVYIGIALLLISVLLVAGCCVAGVVSGLIDSAPKLNEIEIMPQGYATKIYDMDGNVIQTLVGSDANRIYVAIEDIPEHVQKAFIAIEDARFYEHKGIDVRAVIRALYSGISKDNGTQQGASTITQQLLKNQVFEGGNEKTFFARIKRKIQEQCLAVRLENDMDKDQILEYYLNTINLGQNTLGVETASRRYFDKNVSELSLSEAAVIAGITQNPSEYNPITNPESNKTKRKLVLKAMLDNGYISEDEYEDALGDDVYSRILEINRKKSEQKRTVNSYYVDAVIESVITDLKQQLGYTETQAYNALYRGGLNIYSCQKKALQEICDDVVNDDKYYSDGTLNYLSYNLVVLSGEATETYTENDIKEYFSSVEDKDISLYFKEKKSAKKYIQKFKKYVLASGKNFVSEKISFIKQPQVSVVLMDQNTGIVNAIVGGRGEKEADRTLNRATASLRQPGSTFKILSTYLPALDTCGMTLADVVDDAPYFYPGTKTHVNNWDKSGYKGLITLRQAIVWSNNIAAVKTFEKVTPRTGYDYLLNLGFTTLVEKRTTEDGSTYTDIQLPTALGGITDGVTNLELTSAYASVANGGNYIQPILYTKIVDSRGKVILKNSFTKKRVMKESTSWLLTSAMQDVIKEGTGKSAQFKNIDMAQAGKTGTTSDNTDFWFEGYTPYYTAGIWSGYDMNTPQKSENYCKIMWRDIMEKIHKKMKLSNKKFYKPKGIVSCKICTKSGKLADSSTCAQAMGGDTTMTEYFAKGTKPDEICNMHIRYSDGVRLEKDETGYSKKTADTPNISR